MGENTRIEWATHTWSPWLGCSPKHVGCTNCYAQAYFHRMGIGADVRRRTSDANWQKPLAWNKQAAEAERQYEALCKYWLAAHGNQNISGKPERTRVFPSLCDPFEDWVSRKGHPKIVTDPQGHDLYVATPDGYVPKPIGFDSRWEACTLNHLRIDMFNLIDQTPNLDWLLLTKRPENVRKMWEGTPILGKLPDRTNVWLIYSASDQATLEAAQARTQPAGSIQRAPAATSRPPSRWAVTMTGCNSSVAGTLLLAGWENRIFQIGVPSANFNGFQLLSSS